MATTATTPLHILVSGASGLIGTALCAHLRERGHHVHTLVRRDPQKSHEHSWDPVGGRISDEVVSETHVVVNLSGASIGRIPWTTSYRREILGSRIQATRTLVAAISAIRKNPPALIQGSAVGFYGDRAEEVLTEAAAAGSGFLAEVTTQWEAIASGIASHTRVAYARTGLVIARGGAMAPLRLQTLLGVAGPIGSGRQWWPWISLRDEVRAITHLIESPRSEGAYNLVGPEPAQSVDVTKALAKALKRPHWLGLPAIAVNTLMGDAGRELLLASQKVSSEKLQSEGFRFLDTTIEQAISHIL